MNNINKIEDGPEYKNNEVNVKYPSVSLSSTLSRNEKVEKHIRKKTHKPNALRFWVESGVIPLCGSDSCLILVCQKLNSFTFI